MARAWKKDPKLIKIVEEAEAAKADGNEKAIKEMKRKLKKTAEICGAITRKGRVCTRTPVSDNGRCQWHGGKSTGQKTEEGRKKSMANLHPKANVIHGIYSKDFKESLTKEEVELYNHFIDWYFENYKDATDPVNLSLFDRYIMNLIKQARKDAVDFLADSQQYNDFETKLIRFAETLGLNRKFKASTANADNTQKVGIAQLFLEDEDEQN
ncbi:HGGxSTG domain-containing protein [Alteribacillus sp. HJP-4]|uniref:HGGxSTG domain-containing protein n=1 Tax=Alteribacillus sp. HJP-4 TaxID=2775394 RepID=UPI0035CCEB67